jgi:hypothetical protein
MTLDKKSNWASRMSDKQFVLVILLLGSFMIGIATYIVDDVFKKNNFPYPENLHTLVIEVGIGVIITLLIYAFSTKQQNKLTKLVSEIKKLEETQQKIIHEQEESKINRKKIALERIETLLMQILHETQYHKAVLSKYYSLELPHGFKDEDITEQEITKKWIDMLKKQMIRLGEDLRNWTLTSYDLLTPELLYALQCIYSIATAEYYLDKDQPQWDLMDCDGNIGWTKGMLQKYFNHDEKEFQEDDFTISKK